MAKKKEEQQAPQEGLKFLTIDIENFKNLDKRHIDIGGKSIMVIGKNGAGKSSLIQALMSPLNAKLLPTEAVKKGEEKAIVSVTIGGEMYGEHQEYVLDLFFSSKNQSGRLSVTNKNGEAVKSPASFVKSLIGNVSFDIMKWLTQDKKTKLQTIKQLTGVSVELDKIDIEIKNKKDARKYKKQRAEDLEAILSNHNFTPEEIERLSTKIDIQPLQVEMSGISKQQQNYDGVVFKMKEFTSNIERLNSSIQDKKNKIQELMNEISSMENEVSVNNQNIEKGNAWLAVNARPSIEGVNEKINHAILHNEKCDQVSQLSNHHREMIAAKEEVAQFDTDIHILEDKKNRIMSESSLKIEGMTFTDEDIFLDGIPLEEGQVNTARLFDVGVEVAMALNPNLKAIFLHDGSLFDKEALKSIVKKIEDNGYMAIIEMVDYEGGDLEVKFTEKEL